MNKKNKISTEQSYYDFREAEYRYTFDIRTLEEEISECKDKIKDLKRKIINKKQDLRNLKKGLKPYKEGIKDYEKGFIFDEQLKLHDRYYEYISNAADNHFIKYVNDKSIGSLRTAKVYYQIIIDSFRFVPFENEMVKNAKSKLTELNNLFESEINK